MPSVWVVRKQDAQGEVRYFCGAGRYWSPDLEEAKRFASAHQAASAAAGALRRAGAVGNILEHLEVVRVLCRLEPTEEVLYVRPEEG